MKIYHYTNIDTLALILKNKTIRFNRLDRVDDLEEGRLCSHNISFSKYTFVSCWTENIEESIPLWRLYTRENNGVRIGLKKDGMFKKYKLPSKNKYGIIAIPEHEMLLDFPPEEVYEQKNYIVPSYGLSYDSSIEGAFYRKVQYIEDVESKASEALKTVAGSDGIPMGTVISYNNLGTYKHKRWNFEEESRFVLNLLPGNPSAWPLSQMDDGLKDMYFAMVNNKDLPMNYYDKELRDDIFEDMEIILNPMIGESQRIIVEALCEKYAPMATIKDSDFKGKVYLK